MKYDRETMIFTVSQLNEYIKGLLESSTVLSGVSMRGEISNFTAHRSGHFYFTLKDETGQMRAVMFRSAAAKLKFFPENGMNVIVRGRISVYTPTGQYQFYVDGMQPDGVGALAVAFEQLKQKLMKEGLFDEAKKKPLPPFPKRIGVVTSPTGAAICDMINILTRRYPLAELILYAAMVQGEQAPEQLTAGIHYFDHEKSVDLIIIGRGGGSMEDLWAFNDEALARAISACSIPVISAVGHEIDFTICDFVADLRAPTPSAAMELAVPDVQALKKTLRDQFISMQTSLHQRCRMLRDQISALKNSRALTSPHYYIDQKRMEVLQREQRLAALSTILLTHNKQKLTNETQLFRRCAQQMLPQRRQQLAAAANMLHAVSPLAVLSRGFTAVSNENGTLIRSVATLHPNDNVQLQFSDGTAKAHITQIETKQES